jgi:septum formation protein
LGIGFPAARYSAPGTMLILASASPRRADLLRAAGIAFDVEAAEVDETPRPGEASETYVRRLAVEKACAVAARLPDAAVLGADTAVVVEGQVLGKPADADDATRMLRLLSGRRHEVLTGVCLIAPTGEPSAASPGPARPRAEHVTVATTGVWFADLSAADIAWYVASGEPMDKAGAYAIQGLASRFVTAIEGSYSNVVGLPVALVCDLCRSAGIQVS